MNIFMLIVLLSMVDSDIADGYVACKDMTRAQRRHNTWVAINRKRARKTARKDCFGVCYLPWWNSLDEDGNYEKPRLGAKRSGNVQHKSQQHRWDTDSYSHKKNTWKKMYDAPDIERQKHFDKIDAREERYYQKKAADFAAFLTEQERILDKQEEELDKFNQKRFENRMKWYELIIDNNCIPYVDANYPREFYCVEPDVIPKFINLMRMEGAVLYPCTDFIDTWDILHVVGVRTHRNPGLVFG